mgnify:CR=1 FL=1
MLPPGTPEIVIHPFDTADAKASRQTAGLYVGEDNVCSRGRVITIGYRIDTVTDEGYVKIALLLRSSDERSFKMGGVDLASYRRNT